MRTPPCRWRTCVMYTLETQDITTELARSTCEFEVPAAEVHDPGAASASAYVSYRSKTSERMQVIPDHDSR